MTAVLSHAGGANKLSSLHDASPGTSHVRKVGYGHERSVVTNTISRPSLAREDGPPAVELCDIHKSYGTVEVLHGVSLTVRQGEHVVIFGPSGSGKSTLLRVMNLLEVPQSGSVKAFGVEYGSARSPGVARGTPLQLRRTVGMVFQQFNLFPHLTAIENIVLPLRKVKGFNRKDAEDRAADSLQSVGLRQWAAHYPSELSGGQQQRVAIARALSLDPRVMLFDEPTSALDAEVVGEVLIVMRKLAEMGMTMVIVTHELNFAREVGDVNVFVERGLIVESGNRSIYDSPTSERTQRFLRAVL